MLSSLDIIFPKIFSCPSSTKVFQEFGHTFVSYIFGLENKLSFHNIFSFPFILLKHLNIAYPLDK